MDDEAGFLSAIRRDPADDTARLVYADWLDERGDETGRARAEFLRLTARQLDPARPAEDGERLRELAAGLDTDWLAVVSRLKVEGCGSKWTESDVLEWYRRQFRFICDKRWDELTPTEDGAVRVCEGCKENVHYCDTIATARQHAERRRCVAVNLGVARREGDLDPPPLMLGYRLPSRPGLLEDLELALDRLLRDRERQKQESGG